MEDEPATAQPATQPAVFEVGAKCLGRLALDDEWRTAEVVDRKRAQKQSEWQYYVHFQQLNRRLDRWCAELDLRALPDNSEESTTSPAASPHASPTLPSPLSTASPYSSPVRSSQPRPQSLPSPLAASASSASVDRRLTRRDRRLLDDEDDELEYSDEGELEIEREHAEKTKVRNIQTVHIATPASHIPSTVEQSASTSASTRQAATSASVQLSSAYSVDCWYFSPYPMPYRQMSTLYLCGLCFQYFDSSTSLASHFLSRCTVHHPPGNEIYRDESSSVNGMGAISLFCVDGSLSRLWCQCLCLCAKLFLDHKTAIFDCEQFLFFPLVRWLSSGFELLGYFSRSLNSFATASDSHNVACLLTFPHQQQRGYGRFLIAASYALSRVEGRVGRPERPLSDMGRVSYRRWWTEQLMEALTAYGHGSSVMVTELSEHTAIQREDIVSVLRDMDMVTYQKGQYVCTVNQRRIAEWKEQRRMAEAGKPAGWRCNFQPALLQWVPPVFPKWTTQAVQGVRDKRSKTAAKAGKKVAEAEQKDRPAW